MTPLRSTIASHQALTKIAFGLKETARPSGSSRPINYLLLIFKLPGAQTSPRKFRHADYTRKTTGLRAASIPCKQSPMHGEEAARIVAELTNSDRSPGAWKFAIEFRLCPSSSRRDRESRPRLVRIGSRVPDDLVSWKSEREGRREKISLFQRRSLVNSHCFPAPPVSRRIGGSRDSLIPWKRRSSRDRDAHRFLRVIRVAIIDVVRSAGGKGDSSYRFDGDLAKYRSLDSASSSLSYGEKQRAIEERGKR